MLRSRGACTLWLPIPIRARHGGTARVKEKDNKRARNKTKKQRKHDLLDPTFSAVVVGRPNVGKSSLFNKLIGRHTAIVDGTPNVTRDTQDGVASLAGMVFNLYDTPGLEDALTSDPAATKATSDITAGDQIVAHELKVANRRELKEQMLVQTYAAVESSDVVLFMIDGREGVTSWDKHYAKWLRKTCRAPIVLVVNKCEGTFYERVLNFETNPGEFSVHEARALGFGEPVVLSAAHGDGLVDLFQALLPYEHPEDRQDTRGNTPIPAGTKNDEGATVLDTPPLRIAMLGRPNVGKSTIVNSLLGRQRVIVADVPGVTRDSIEINDAWTVPKALRRMASLRADHFADSFHPSTFDEDLSLKYSDRPREVDDSGADEWEASSGADGGASEEEGDATEEGVDSNDVAQRVTVVDTAGIFKAKQVDPTKRKTAGVVGRGRDISVLNFKTFRNTLAAIRNSHVTTLVVDIPDLPEGLSHEDALYELRHGDHQVFSRSDSTLINLVHEEGRPLVIAVNKWDQLGGKGRSTFNPIRRKKRGFETKKEAEKRLDFSARTMIIIQEKLEHVMTVPLSGVEIVPLTSDPSSEVVERVRPMRPRNALWPAILRAHDQWCFRVGTSKLNDWLRAVTAAHSPPEKIMYCTQGRTRPPTFVLFSRSKPGTAWGPYMRYLSNELRSAYGLDGTPLRFKIKSTRKGGAKPKKTDHK